MLRVWGEGIKARELRDWIEGFMGDSLMILAFYVQKKILLRGCVGTRSSRGGGAQIQPVVSQVAAWRTWAI